MINTSNLLRWIAVLLFIPSASAYAHVKWFIDVDKVTRDPSLTYHLSDPAVQL